MTDAAWRALSGRLGWLIAGTFLVASVIYGLLQFNVTAPEPEFLPDGTFVDNILTGFENQQGRWIQDLTSSLLFGVGFVAVAVLGATLHRIDRDDPRSAVMAVAFLLAGAVGTASQLIYVGGIEVATSPEYCDCGFLAEEIVSRAMAANILGGIVSWMIDGFTVLFVIGLWAFAGLAARSEWVPNRLGIFTRVLAVIGILAVGWGRVAVPLLSGSGVEFDFDLLGGIITLVIAGVLTPLWAVWLARSAGRSDRDSSIEAAA